MLRHRHGVCLHARRECCGRRTPSRRSRSRLQRAWEPNHMNGTFPQRSECRGNPPPPAGLAGATAHADHVGPSLRRGTTFLEDHRDFSRSHRLLRSRERRAHCATRADVLSKYRSLPVKRRRLNSTTPKGRHFAVASDRLTALGRMTVICAVVAAVDIVEVLLGFGHSTPAGRVVAQVDAIRLIRKATLR